MPDAAKSFSISLSLVVKNKKGRLRGEVRKQAVR
jgi:hypothetical protein